MDLESHEIYHAEQMVFIGEWKKFKLFLNSSLMYFKQLTAFLEV